MSNLQAKLQQEFRIQNCCILKSYLSERLLSIKCGSNYSKFKEIIAGLQQGSVLYLLHTRDIPQDEDRTIAAFTDDTSIRPLPNVEEAMQNYKNLWIKLALGSKSGT